jgi:hypothetical protein
MELHICNSRQIPTSDESSRRSFHAGVQTGLMFCVEAAAQASILTVFVAASTGSGRLL